jgi:hypothetical protein
MIDFLKNIYNHFYEISLALGVEGEFYINLFSILLILLIIFLTVFLVKTCIQYFNLLNEAQKIKRRIYKLFIETLKNNNLN